MLSTIAVAAVTAIITSVICCNLSAKITFISIDKYVTDMIEKAKKLIWDAHINK